MGARDGRGDGVDGCGLRAWDASARCGRRRRPPGCRHGSLASWPFRTTAPSASTIRRGLNEHVMPIGANMAVRAVGGPADRRVARRTGQAAAHAALRRGPRVLPAHAEGRNARRVRTAAPRSRTSSRPSACAAATSAAGCTTTDESVSALEREFPTTSRYLLGVPRYLWREAAAEVARLGRALAPRRAADRFASLTRLSWFVGYLRGAWQGRCMPIRAPRSDRRQPGDRYRHAVPAARRQHRDRRLPDAVHASATWASASTGSGCSWRR